MKNIEVCLSVQINMKNKKKNHYSIMHGKLIHVNKLDKFMTKFSILIIVIISLYLLF